MQQMISLGVRRTADMYETLSQSDSWKEKTIFVMHYFAKRMPTLLAETLTFTFRKILQFLFFYNLKKCNFSPKFRKMVDSFSF